jgi:hypothetical protein
MNTKNKLNEHTANLALAYAPAIVAHVGRNFAKPIPRLATNSKPVSYLEKLIKFGRKL